MSNIPGKPDQTSVVLPVERRRQVSLRGLFVGTSYFAVSSLLASRFGLGIFVLMNGAFLSWVGHRGYLWWLQTNRSRPKLFGVGWLLFAVSLALPALTFKGCGGGQPTTYYGWQAAVSTVVIGEEVLNETSSFLTGEKERSWKTVRELISAYILIALWNLPNLLMLASPFILWRQQRGEGSFLSAVLSCAAVSSWMWGVHESEDLRIGYYVWSSGITLLSLGRPAGWKTLGAMVVTGLSLLFFGWIGF